MRIRNINIEKNSLVIVLDANDNKNNIHCNVINYLANHNQSGISVAGDNVIETLNRNNISILPLDEVRKYKTYASKNAYVVRLK